MTRLLTFSLIFLVLSGCGENTSQGSSTKDSVKTNVGEEVPGGIEAEIIAFDFEKTPEEADLIAEIVIGDKLEEIPEEPIPYTLFEAEIKQIFKGIPVAKNIVIKQHGDSIWVVNGNKLFEKGEEFILFLKETTVSKGDYWILGEETGMFRIVGDNKIVKLSYPIEELKDIEVEEGFTGLEEVDFSNEPIEDSETLQVLNKVEFVKILESLEAE